MSGDIEITDWGKTPPIRSWLLSHRPGPGSLDSYLAGQVFAGAYCPQTRQASACGFSLFGYCFFAILLRFDTRSPRQKIRHTSWGPTGSRTASEVGLTSSVSRKHDGPSEQRYKKTTQDILGCSGMQQAPSKKLPRNRLLSLANRVRLSSHCLETVWAWFC
ncbi:hypothetical protein B0T25DRAFT_13660 [Lasiosphaeria hispida]|uniref:Uncharacterized protein n=1 Tax=Lasiosphaeria hispida TaxID=260671 RepID=A0AAJ0HU34_9PEZI|nr:hypothetical protein B0T25DRAFT_13660 [Lasiosphaeria hispida]